MQAPPLCLTEPYTRLSDTALLASDFTGNTGFFVLFAQLAL